jgi:hypothetical protein
VPKRSVAVLKIDEEPKMKSKNFLVLLSAAVLLGATALTVTPASAREYEDGGKGDSKVMREQMMQQMHECMDSTKEGKGMDIDPGDGGDNKAMRKRMLARMEDCMKGMEEHAMKQDDGKKSRSHDHRKSKHQLGGGMGKSDSDGGVGPHDHRDMKQ